MIQPPDNLMNNPALFWVVAIVAAVLLSIVGFLVRYIFVDVKNTLKSVQQTLQHMDSAYRVLDTKLTHQKDLMNLLRNDFKGHVEQVLKEYEELQTLLKEVEKRHTSLDGKVVELDHQFKLCQQKCGARGDT